MEGKHRLNAVARRDQESRRWQIFDMDLEENASWDFMGNTTVKIERGLVGT